ncbi:MAG: hypothetical protein LQ344_006209 [Seirophora lacunosa]|nr:MAG: hypothetical protein LQ344_006209 [Seirophora lacunosa]
MSYLNQGSLLGSVRLQQTIQERISKKAHHEYAHAPSPYPLPYCYIPRNPHGISYLDFQNTRRVLEEQVAAAAAQQRCLRFEQAQEEQRREREREAEAKRIASVHDAINKMRMGTSLTVEDKYAMRDDARREEQRKLDRELAGPAGAELEAAAAAAAAVDDNDEASSYRGEYEEEAREQRPHNRRAERTSSPPPPPRRQHSTHHRRRRPPGRNLLHQLLVFLPLILLTLLHRALACPDGFRLCPCGLVKRLSRFLARNPHAVGAPLAMLLVMHWRSVLVFVARAVGEAVCVGVVGLRWLLLLGCEVF